MVYYRLNYYVKSGTVTDFAPYNFFIMLIQLLHVKNPITGTIWNLHIFLNCEIYNRCLHICTYNMNYKKIKKNSVNIHSHTSKELFLIPIVQKLLSENLVLNYYELKKPQQHCLWLIYNARYPFFLKVKS